MSVMAMLRQLTNFTDQFDEAITVSLEPLPVHTDRATGFWFRPALR
jgi:hypothetical protein